MSPSTKLVQQAGIEGLNKKNRPYQLGVDDFFQPIKDLRESIAKLLKANDPDRIALIPSASYGLANAAANLNPEPNQNIVVIGGQFPSNVFTWQKLAARCGSTLRIVNPPSVSANVSRGKAWNKAILDAIDTKTAVVAMAPLHWADGTVFDVAKIRAKTLQYGAALVLDGTQAIGAMPFNIEEIQPDALICAGYKWLLGPYGMGFAWYGPRFDQGLPIENNWINRLHSDEFSDLTTYEGSYRPAAQRFSMGEVSNFITVPMLQQALSHLLEWGVDNIQSYCENLTEAPLKILREKGFIIEEKPYQASHLFGIRLPKSQSMEDVFTQFEKANIKVSLRGDAIRVAPHLYNDANDMDRLVEALTSFGQ
ncbi:MAG: aminotransferase class V-fold PLP-dependent enzyme [Bacteroidia bacterium]